MLMALKAFVAISAIGGCASVPWFLQKMNEQNTLPSEEKAQTPETSSPSRIVRKAEKLIPATQFLKTSKENCQVIDFPDLNSVLFDLEITNTYVPVFCEGTSKDFSDKIPNQWKGLFPDHLFVNKHELNNKGKKFEITTNTTVLEDNTIQTVFEGELHVSITGKWDKVTPAYGETATYQVQEIKFEQPQSSKIFLFLSQSN